MACSPRFGSTRSPPAHSVPLSASLNQSRVFRTLLIAVRDKGAVPARLLQALPIALQRAGMSSSQDGDGVRTSDGSINSGPRDAESTRSERRLPLGGAAAGALRRNRVGLTFVGKKRDLLSMDGEEDVYAVIAARRRLRRATTEAREARESLQHERTVDEKTERTRKNTLIDPTPAEPRSGPGAAESVQVREGASSEATPGRHEDGGWLYMNRATSSSRPNRALLPEDRAILDSWQHNTTSRPHTFQGPQVVARPGWTERLMDFCVAAYVDNWSSDLNLWQNSVLSPAYYDTFIAPLRNMNTGKVSARERPEEGHLSVVASESEFQRSGAVGVGAGARHLAEQECVFLPVNVTDVVPGWDGHWVLIVMTNVDALHAIVNQTKMAVGDTRRPRLLVVDPVKGRSGRLAEVVLENVHHWLTCMLMLHYGCEVKTGEDGNLLWSVKDSKLHKVWRSRSSTDAFDNVLRMVKRTAKVVSIPSPQVEHASMSGPYCVLALYVLAAVSQDLKGLKAEWEARCNMRLQNAYCEKDAVKLSGIVYEAARSLVEAPIENGPTKDQFMTQSASASERVKALIPRPFVSNASGISLQWGDSARGGAGE